MGRLKEIFPEGMQHFDIQIIHKLSKKIYNINVYYTYHYIKKFIHLHYAILDVIA